MCMYLNVGKLNCEPMRVSLLDNDRISAFHLVPLVKAIFHQTKHCKLVFFETTDVSFSLPHKNCFSVTFFSSGV